MDIDYGFWFYYSFEEIQQNGIEKFFNNLKAKLESNIDQVKRTTELYESDYNLSKNEIKVQYEADLAKAEVKYNEVFAENAQDPHFAAQIAAHESGMDQIEAWYRDQDEPLFYTFRDMQDNYYKSALGLLQTQFEGEIKHLCELLKQEFLISKDLKNVRSGSGGLLLDVNTYLNNWIGLNLNDLGTCIQKMDDFRLFRNRLTHEMGIVDQHEPWLTNTMTNPSFIELEPVDGGEQIRIYTPDYIYDLHATLSTFFRSLFWKIDEKKNYTLLKEKFKHFFGFIDPGTLNISNFSVSDITSSQFGKTVDLILEFDRNPPQSFIGQIESVPVVVPDLHKIKVQLVFSEGNDDHIEIINNTQEQKVIRLKRNLEQNPEIPLRRIFNLFYFTSKGREMKITFSEL